VAPRDRPGMLLAGPHWSPDGTALVFEAVGLSAAGQASVTAEWVAADGSGRRTVANAARYPSFSPDGTSIVFTRALPTGDALWVQPLDGSPGREVVPESKFLIVTYARFSPDGQWIAFTGVSDATPIFPPPLPTPTGSPTVPKLLLSGRGMGGLDLRGVANHGYPAEPFVVSAAGGEPRRLAELPIDDAAIAWSPDGASVAVSGANGLFLIGVADGVVRRVTENGSFGAIDWR
jgi:Tol biopolymer transport system component